MQLNPYNSNLFKEASNTISFGLANEMKHNVFQNKANQLREDVLNNLEFGPMSQRSMPRSNENDENEEYQYKHSKT